jgi:hypothetical protein
MYQHTGFTLDMIREHQVPLVVPIGSVQVAQPVGSMQHTAQAFTPLLPVW